MEKCLYKYIIRKLSIVWNVFNDILIENNIKIKNYSDNFSLTIYNSELNYLKKENQIDILQKNETKFLKAIHILKKISKK